jgi:hypothetical protein
MLGLCYILKNVFVGVSDSSMSCMSHCRRETNGVFVVILYITKIWVGSDHSWCRCLGKVSNAKYIGCNKILVSKCFSQIVKQRIVQPIFRDYVRIKGKLPSAINLID